MTEQVGWFVWGKPVKGRLTRSKIDLIMYPWRKDALARQQQYELKKHPIDAADWALSLDELAVKFPPPDVAGVMPDAPQ